MKCLTMLTLCIIMLIYASCESTDDASPPVFLDAPAAPAQMTTDWIAHNVRVKSFTTTRTQILVWLTYERDGTQTVSRLIEIDK